MKFKPMLAGKAPKDLGVLTYPLYVSPKLDGIRCLIQNGEAVSRSLKPIPNAHVQQSLRNLMPGLDGELMLRETAPYNDIQSAMMSRDGKPDFIYYVFDWCLRKGDVRTYGHRYTELVNNFKEMIGSLSYVRLLHHGVVDSPENLLKAERNYLDEGYEGLMIRCPKGRYKHGRSTTKQGWLLKLKRFEDAEAIVIGYDEQMHNGNPAELDALGHTKRSSHQEHLVPTGKLGSLICQTDDGVEFSVGTGFDDAQRINLWQGRESLIGKVVTYKHQPDPNDPSIAPRFPVFLHFRED